MAQYGLYPKGEIRFDGQYHRMPGADKGPKNRAAWYVAAIDRSHVNFGDWSTGLKSFWRDNKKGRYDEAALKKWRAEAKQAEKDQAEKAEYARAQMHSTWDSAGAASAMHPYLKAKSISAKKVFRTVRQMRDRNGEDVLLVPMRIGRKLMNVQRVYGNGAKRFWPGQSWEGSAYTFGARPITNTVYVCEGWATGHAIHQVTGCTVVVAFVAANLRNVTARLAEQLNGKRIIVAADNDRWTEGVLAGGRKVPNPGVWYAQDAASISDKVEVAIPDFQQLGKKPTDYDDLLSLEDATAVLQWLDPMNATRAITDHVEAEEVADDEGEYAEMWKTAPFTCLGLSVPPGRSPNYCVMDHDSGETWVLAANTMKSETTWLQIAPLAWWETHFGTLKGGAVNWSAVAACIMDMCKRKGRIKRGHNREIGAWSVPGGLVVHCGRKLIDHAGDECIPWKYHADTDHVYGPTNEALPVPHEPLSLDECQKVFSVLERFSWRYKGCAWLVAGWALLAPVCGLLRWRPHVWINGPAGTGKSTLLAEVVRPLTSPTAIKIEAGTTEASLRRVLGRSARPVLIDELERKRGNRDIYVRAILDFVRSSSSADAPILKSQGDGVVEYGAHSMFMLASVAGGVENVADATRISAVSLKPHRIGAEAAEAWDVQLRDIGNITPRTGCAMWTRTLDLARSGVLQKTLKIGRSAVESHAKSARKGDQQGTLLAGAWLMLNDEPPDGESEFVEWYQSADWGDARSAALQGTEGQLILDRILQSRDQYKYVDKPVGEMLVNVIRNPVDSLQEAASLERCGLKVNGTRLMIAVKSEFVRSALQETPYGFAWKDLLKAMPGVKQGPQIRFSGVRSYTVAVPLKLFMD